MAIAPQQPTRLFTGGARGFIEKQRMHRGAATVIHERAQRAEQSGLERRGAQIGARQQPRASRGRERHRAHQLRVVTQPTLLGGSRPGHVEHELAPGMILAIHRCRGREPLGVKQRQVLRRPTAARTGAAAELEGAQEFVTQEGVFTRERVPLQLRDLAEVGERAQLQRCGRRRAAREAAHTVSALLAPLLAAWSNCSR